MAGAFWCIVEDDRQGNPKKVTAEVLGEASRLAVKAGGQVEAVWLTDKATEAGLKLLAEWGAKRVWLCESPAFAPYRGEVWTPVVADLAGKESPKAIFGAVTTRQRELLARLAARLGAGLSADSTVLALDGDRLVATRPVYAGKLLAQMTWAKTPWLATLRPNVFRAEDPQAAAAAAVERPAVSVPRHGSPARGLSPEDCASRAGASRYTLGKHSSYACAPRTDAQKLLDDNFRPAT